MKIKEAAAKLNISARAIRFYEEKGLIRPLKQVSNQYREFTEQDLWKLQTIIALREAGMTVEDIREALESRNGADNRELNDFLQLQRSVLVSKWLEIRQIIEMTDGMIEALDKNGVLPLDDMYRLAEGSKRLREQRSSWKDQWGYDQMAELHDVRVQDGSSQKYKDYEAALQLIVKWIAPINGEQGLDIGTGTGNLAGLLMTRGAEMAGVDQSKEMLRLCRDKYPQMETKRGNFLAIPYLESRFDFVVSSFAFHHLTDEQKVLAIHEMRRVLKPKGRICVADLMAAEEQIIYGDSSPSSLAGLQQLLEELGYVTKHQRMNEQLCIVYAVPIR